MIGHLLTSPALPPRRAPFTASIRGTSRRAPAPAEIAALSSTQTRFRVMPADRPPNLVGGCVCGNVRYSAAGRSDRAYACHCDECQTRSGSAFAMLLPVAADRFSVSGDTVSVDQEEANGVVATLHLCSHCLTRIYTENPLWDQLVILRAGTLDDSARVLPAFHLWVQSKQDWFDLPADALQYDTQPSDPANGAGSSAERVRMSEYRYETVDVFTGQKFGGNPLAVFWDARGLSTEQMQALSAEMNYSETTFVLPPDDPANTARVRIFNRTSEMPFAGHPNVGTACVLATLGIAPGPVLQFEEISGLVEIRLDGLSRAEIDAPQCLQTFETFDPEAIARCLSLTPGEVQIAAHPPVRASVGVDFVFVELDAHSLSRAVPDLTGFRDLEGGYPALGGRLSIFLYAREADGVRARMFAPLAGTWEDPATGSANATLAALRLSLSGEREQSYRAIQGVEMGRRSELEVRAWRAPDGIRAAVGGDCVPVFSGKIEI